MTSPPRHRPFRRFPAAPRRIYECDFEVCPHCGDRLRPRRPWHMRKTVQTLDGPLFVAGKSKECPNPDCPYPGLHYYAHEVLQVSLPHSTYGLDVLAFIGWQHEKEHRQLAEIQRELNRQGVLINERTVGKLYRQFLALLGGLNDRKRERLAASAREHGGVLWAIDALQPEGHGTLLYVLYEVLSEMPVSAIQLASPTAIELSDWLQPIQALPYPVLATLSDGEQAILAAMKTSWPHAPHQLCQAHFLSNLAKPVMEVDHRLRQQMKDELGGLPPLDEERPLLSENILADDPPDVSVPSSSPSSSEETPARSEASEALPLF